MSDDTSSHVRVSHLYDELLYVPSKISSCRYLGLHIDDDLNWKTHIEYVSLYGPSSGAKQIKID